MRDAEKKSILVIDDDVTIRKLITHHLKLNNYLTHEAKNAEEAFQILNKAHIDLVLSDVTMDEMDGFEFCEKVRSNEKHRFLPFVFVTAKNTLEDKFKAIESGGDDIITKPFDIKELILKVQALLKRTEIYRTYGLKKSIQTTFTERKTKILFVDDDPTITKLFKYNLESAGFDCNTVNSVDEALKVAKHFHPDIIISDIMMPGTNGYDFRKKLLEDDELKNVPFIFLTAKATDEDILEGYDLGITDYVVKTAGPKIVIAKVSAIIRSLKDERNKAISELHQAASSLGAKVVPDNAPTFNGFEIKQWHIPYRGIPGGDFIDYYKVDDNNLIIILGDVMGKKWGAWYFAFAYAGYIRSSIRGTLQSVDAYSPAEILNRVNDAVYQDSKISEVFVAISVVLINNKTFELKYCGAGDVPLILKENQSKQIKKISSDGLLLGFNKKGNYSDTLLKLKNGDVIVMMTDGITESRSKEGKQFGESKLDSVLISDEFDKSPMEKLKEEFIDFTNQNFEDDISLISIKLKD
ncbi:Response regulator [Ignavibacterium album JCM 16511]|uniref:Response regulator n=1 Tax=Ignavibacterium album (strain DSM 19864 / JCM 16511 / NBRC 101810 / Mat9-16) TaxID=945713 RepID=I0AGL6_IGNAJ|nr:response regulator [Ignavibacterium album]AFH48123.1 Response regulator [Ignavibacterium album JCM 16511]